MKEKKHYQYIDRMKGFTMLLVVIGHVVAFSFEQKGSPIGMGISSFHMPLFIFLSGLVISTPPHLLKIVKITCRFMVPMLFVGLLFTLFIHESPKGFFMNSAKYGYWYLQVLTTFYITMSLFNINKNRLLAVDLLLAVVIWGLFWIGSKTARQDNDVLCLINCKLLWPYFVFGFLCNQHRQLIDILCHTRTYSIAFVLTIATLYLYIAEGFSPIRYAVPTVAIITCLYLFRMREQKDSAAERQLSFFGRHSLIIYIFHYFFIYNIHFEGLGSWFERTGNWMVEFFLCCIMAFLVSYLSIFLGLTMEKGLFLRTIFLGKFPQFK